MKLIVRGAYAMQQLVFRLHDHRRMQAKRQFSLRSLYQNVPSGQLHLHPVRNGNRLLSDARHVPSTRWTLDVSGVLKKNVCSQTIGGSTIRAYQTWQSTSPPTPRSFAARSVMSPCEVERIATPKPLITRGKRRELAYTRSPGRLTRRRPLIIR